MLKVCLILTGINIVMLWMLIKALTYEIKKKYEKRSKDVNVWEKIVYLILLTSIPMFSTMCMVAVWFTYASKKEEVIRNIVKDERYVLKEVDTNTNK